MRYVIIAILLYFVFLFVRRFLQKISVTKDNKTQNPIDTSQKKTYDVNMIQDAEFREVKKD